VQGSEQRPAACFIVLYEDRSECLLAQFGEQRVDRREFVYLDAYGNEGITDSLAKLPLVNQRREPHGAPARRKKQGRNAEVSHELG
jgi:hypothetical protein